eukprot:5193162-Prymnesium_polylepis.1
MAVADHVLQKVEQCSDPTCPECILRPTVGTCRGHRDAVEVAVAEHAQAVSKIAVCRDGDCVVRGDSEHKQPVLHDRISDPA